MPAGYGRKHHNVRVLLAMAGWQDARRAPQKALRRGQPPSFAMRGGVAAPEESRSEGMAETRMEASHQKQANARKMAENPRF